MNYPDRHHPCYFLEDALTKLGADARVIRDGDATLGCWGLLVNGKLMVWLIDNRHPHEAATEDPAAKRLLERGVLVCHAQKPDAERVGGKWLPLAVTPGYRPPDQPVEKLYDVAFVGYVRDAGRQSVLAHVARHFKLNVHQGVFGDDAVGAYWSAKVGLNVPTGYGQADAYDSANMRCFEILATGTPLVTPWEDYLSELGISGNAFFYNTADILIASIRAALRDGDEYLQGTGAAGAVLTRERHTYEHRAKQVLEWLK
jgi:hypothetical protein